jgi:hypothetical protein
VTERGCQLRPPVAAAESKSAIARHFSRRIQSPRRRQTSMAEEVSECLPTTIICLDRSRHSTKRSSGTCRLDLRPDRTASFSIKQTPKLLAILLPPRADGGPIASGSGRAVEALEFGIRPHSLVVASRQEMLLGGRRRTPAGASPIAPSLPVRRHHGAASKRRTEGSVWRRRAGRWQTADAGLFCRALDFVALPDGLVIIE